MPRNLARAPSASRFASDSRRGSRRGRSRSFSTPGSRFSSAPPSSMCFACFSPMACPAGWAGPWSPPPPGWSRPDSGGEPVPQRVSGGRRDWLFGRSPQPPATGREIHRARNRAPLAGTIQSAAGRALARAPKTRPPAGGRRSHPSGFECASPSPRIRLPPRSSGLSARSAPPRPTAGVHGPRAGRSFSPRASSGAMSSRGCWNNPWPATGSATGRRETPAPPVPAPVSAAGRSTPTAGCPPAGLAAPDRPPGKSNRRGGRCPPRRASIVAMVASKLSINARMPESVRVSVHLRWLGSLPGRVPVNAPRKV